MFGEDADVQKANEAYKEEIDKRSQMLDVFVCRCFH